MLTDFNTCAVLKFRGLLLVSVFLAGLLPGCGRPGLQQLQSDISAAAGRTGPTSDPQRLAVHRAEVRQAVTLALQSATDQTRPQLLQHCRTLAAAQFSQTYQFPTIAEP